MLPGAKASDWAATPTISPADWARINTEQKEESAKSAFIRGSEALRIDQS